MTMTLPEIAAKIGRGFETTRGYHKAATRARAANAATPATMPAPAGIDDNGANVWSIADVDAWIVARANTTPPRRGAIAKSTVAAMLDACERGDVDTAIQIARKALA